MSYKLSWEKLFCENRMREYERKNETRPFDKSRNAFDADYDRIVGSSSVRRLQDKAQVFPLQENDFTRTRLTHSMEVSAMARSMGKQVGYKLEEKGEFERYDTEKLEALLQTAGLIHDLGNPPFGHYGETAIGEWFKDRFKKDKNLAKELTDTQREEFEHYDGNVQNLRIVSKLQTMNDRYGANFTFATMACIMKYPWGIDHSRVKNADPNKKVKYGYYESETELVKAIYDQTGIFDEIRHPATFIMEAADDIVYIGDDIEDGVKKGYINWDYEYKQLFNEYNEKESLNSFFNDIQDYDLKINEYLSKEEKLTSRVRYFRNAVQGFLINVAITNFISHYNEIMNGSFKKEDLLFSEEEFVESLKGITKRNCFGCREVVSLEILGRTVIRGLLDVFVDALLHAELDSNDTKSFEGKIYSLISPNFKYIIRQDYSCKENTMREEKDLSYYDKLRLIVDFVSGMTDSYAMNLYQELTGIKLHYQ